MDETEETPCLKVLFERVISYAHPTVPDKWVLKAKTFE